MPPLNWCCRFQYDLDYLYVQDLAVPVATLKVNVALFPQGVVGGMASGAGTPAQHSGGVTLWSFFPDAQARITAAALLVGRRQCHKRGLSLIMRKMHEDLCRGSVADRQVNLSSL